MGRARGSEDLKLRDEACQVEEQDDACDDEKDDDVFASLASLVVGGDVPGEDDEHEGGEGSPEVGAADGEGRLQPEDDEDAGDEHEPRPPAFAQERPPEERGGGENQDVFKRHLEALIDPRRAAVCGEDDEGDEDEAEEEGEEVFVREETLHWMVESGE